jgi:uncharacterized membrane protein YkvA (DUF1232 family)
MSGVSGERPSMLQTLKRRAGALKAETYALYLAMRDRRTPWYAKLLAGAVVAYAVSPIDLIPDFIPVLGYLDDLILLPLGIWLALRAIPEPVMAEARARAAQALDARAPRSRAAAVVVVVIWVAMAMLVAAVVARLLGR